MTTQEPTIQADDRFALGAAAKALGVCRTTLRNYIATGEIEVHVHRYTGRKYILGASIIAFWRGEPLRRSRR